MVNASLITIVGLMFATALMIGFGFVVPVSGAIASVCEVLVVATAVFLVGLLEGE